MADLGDICLRSRPLNGTTAVEIEIPVRSLAGELEDKIPRASAYKDLKTVCGHRSGRKKLPEITVVARRKKKTV